MTPLAWLYRWIISDDALRSRPPLTLIEELTRSLAVALKRDLFRQVYERPSGGLFDAYYLSSEADEREGRR